MVLGCYYLTMDRSRRQGEAARASSSTRTRPSWPTSSARSGCTTRSRSWCRAWDAEAGTLADERRRTTVGRIIFNQILPEPLRFSDEVMDRSRAQAARRRVLPAARPDETAYLVDGIKTIGFDYATRGGTDDRPLGHRRCRPTRAAGWPTRTAPSARSTSSSSAASSPRTSATSRSSSSGSGRPRTSPTR